eukprot:Hpha_TRINITY_DN12076_c0_g1::TRINITY_DN12076_c0_g1_i1::g.140861::m.140861
MGSAASAGVPSAKESASKIVEEEIESAKQPSLSYMSCFDVFAKGNAYGVEITRRKIAAGFPRGKVPTDEWIWEQLRKEWCDPYALKIPADKKEDFGTEESLAGDKEAWDYATNAVPEDPEKRRDCWKLIRDNGHEGLTLEGFMQKEIAVKAKLTKVQVLSLRLYTGPGYSSLNKSLRGLQLRFSITARVISITIIQIVDAIGRAPRCFRGMSIPLSDSYLEYYQKMTEEMIITSEGELKPAPKPAPKKQGGLLGGLMKGAQLVGSVVEKGLEVGKNIIKHNWERGEGFFGPVPFDPAPLSFTTLYSKAKGFTYKKDTGIILGFVENGLCREETPALKIGMGAPISWCSQYPTEAEILFPPFTAMLPYALEHRDLRPLMKQKTREELLELLKAKTPPNFLFMPVTYCSWNTQWDVVDGMNKQKQRSKSPQPPRSAPMS